MPVSAAYPQLSIMLTCLQEILAAVHYQVLVFFTWVVRGVADTVSMWDAVQRIHILCHSGGAALYAL